MSFPNYYSAGLDGTSTQNLTDLTARWNGQTGKRANGQTGQKVLRALTILVNVILVGNVSFEHRPCFLGAKLSALKQPDGGFRPIAVGNVINRCPQNAPDIMSLNHVKRDTEVDK